MREIIGIIMILSKPKIAMHEIIGISIGARISEQKVLERCIKRVNIIGWPRRWGVIKV